MSTAYTYQYDRDRRLKKIIYPSAAEMVYSYDNGLLDLITLPGSEGTVDYAYGNSTCPERLTSIAKGSESVTFTYEGPLLTGQTFDGVLDATLSYGYLDTTSNQDFLVDSITYAGGTESFAYDANRLLTGSGAFTILRESSTGLPDSIGDGTVLVEPVFNGYGEVETTTYKVGGSAKATIGLGFAPYTGEIDSKTETVSGTTTTYGYDYTDLGQLEEVTKNSTVVEEYHYDANGNREYQKLSGTERWLTYDNEDRLDKIYSNSAKTVQVADYNYDADGFLTDRTEGGVTTTYDYDSQGQLLSVLNSTGTLQGVRYKYDALGRRVQKETKTGGVWTVTEKYLWAGMNQGLLAVYDGSNNLVMRFRYAGGRLPVAMDYNSATYYLAYDQVGSLRAVYDASGSKVKEYTYDSFGVPAAPTGSLAANIPFGFAGGLHDRDTGLVLFGHRDYDPKVGRWTAKDPIGFAGGDVTLYGYALANPISFADPDGLSFIDVVQNILGIAGMIPGVGIIPDAIDAAINVVRGQWIAAVVSVGAMVPVVGDIGRGADKLNDARKVCKIPNPWGSKGGPAHRAAVDAAIRQRESLGYTHIGGGNLPE